MADKKGGTRRSNKVSRPRARTWQGIGEIRGSARERNVDDVVTRMQRGQSTDHMN